MWSVRQKPRPVRFRCGCVVAPVSQFRLVLGGSWDLASKVLSTLIGVIISYNYSYLIYNCLVTKSHDPLSTLRIHVPKEYFGLKVVPI